MIEYSRHHLLPQKLGGTWHYNNIVRIRHNVHQAIHTLFSASSPIGQIRNIVSLNKGALSNEFYNEITKVLERYSGIMELTAYNPKCVRESLFIKSLG